MDTKGKNYITCDVLWGNQYGTVLIRLLVCLLISNKKTCNFHPLTIKNPFTGQLYRDKISYAFPYESWRSRVERQVTFTPFF
jgi:hypothetical protein